MSSQPTDLFDYAARRRDCGMGRAADAEDREQPTFADAAFETIQKIARRQEEVHVDDILAECPVKPRHYNAWGAVWMRAIKAGVIKHSGRVRPSTDLKKNKHQYPIYQSLIFERELYA